MCPNGALDKEGIMELYAMPRKEAQVFIDQMFLMFDRDGNGTISFKVRLITQFLCQSGWLQEFVLATNMTTCGSVEDKMRWAFKMYDTDGSGENEYEILKGELGLTRDKY